MAGSSSSSAGVSPTIPSDYFWLSPSFDPNMTLAVELRRMLKAHNVPLRNASTKADLVKLFEQRIQEKRPALLASVTPTPTPTPQARAKTSKRGHRKAKPTAPAAESSSSSDASGEEEDSHDDDNNDDDGQKRNDNEPNGVGAKPQPRSLRPRPTTGQKASPKGQNGARQAKNKGDKDKGDKMSQLAADVEELVVTVDLEREHLQVVGDAMSTLLDNYLNTRKHITKIRKKVKALNSQER